MVRRFEERSYTIEQYFELERNSEQKHEYFQGQIYLITGGSPNQSLIASNINWLLKNSLVGKGCRVFTSDLQIYIERNGLATYPDVSVVCGPLAYGKENRNVVTNPLILVEVLSPSTSHYDMNDKFDLYKELDSFEDYLLADSLKKHVVYYHKIGLNQWIQQIFTRPQEVVTLQSRNIELTLAQIYDQVEFDSEPEPLHPTENP